MHLERQAGTDHTHLSRQCKEFRFDVKCNGKLLEETTQGHERIQGGFPGWSCSVERVKVKAWGEGGPQEATITANRGGFGGKQPAQVVAGTRKWRIKI